MRREYIDTTVLYALILNLELKKKTQQIKIWLKLRFS